MEYRTKHCFPFYAKFMQLMLVTTMHVKLTWMGSSWIIYFHLTIKSSESTSSYWNNPLLQHKSWHLERCIVWMLSLAWSCSWDCIWETLPVISYVFSLIFLGCWICPRKSEESWKETRRESIWPWRLEHSHSRGTGLVT